MGGNTLSVAMIDGDILVFKFAHACQEVIHWADDIYTTHGNFRAASIMLDEAILKIRKETKTCAVRVFLTSSTNFRTDVLPEYKENRKTTARPILVNPLREHLFKWYDAEMEEGLEADDLLGMATYKKIGAICCSIDKDLRTVEGLHYNFDKPEEGVVKVKEKDAARQFYTQVLTGDTVDNFKGLPGCGPKSAEKILDGASSVTEMWLRVLEAYEKKGLSEEDAVQQARCAYILKKKTDWSRDKGVRLWTPPKKRIAKTVVEKNQHTRTEGAPSEMSAMGPSTQGGKSS